MRTNINGIFLFIITAVPTLAHAQVVGYFPGLQKLIETADNIVILKIKKNVDENVGPSGFSTHDCYIHQTLKGDVPVNKLVRLGLLDTRTSFVSPFAVGSIHLMFLTKKHAPTEPTEYHTITYEGANVLITPFGHEKMPPKLTIENKIKWLLKQTVTYDEKEHSKKDKYLAMMIKGTAEPMDSAARGWNDRH